MFERVAIQYFFHIVTFLSAKSKMQKLQFEMFWKELPHIHNSWLARNYEQILT